MIKLKHILFIVCYSIVPSISNATPSIYAKITTTKGSFVIDLETEKAPKTVANFLRYAKAGLYNGTVFHRVIPTFMIQCGGYDIRLNKRKTFRPIKNESHKLGPFNSKWYVSMARTSDPDSATNQFFINTQANNFLNKTDTNPGYAVFGKIISGKDTINKIANTPTTKYKSFKHIPIKPITITSIEIQR